MENNYGHSGHSGSYHFSFFLSFFLSFFFSLSFTLGGPGREAAPGGLGIASPPIYHRLKTMRKEEYILITV